MSTPRSSIVDSGPPDQRAAILDATLRVLTEHGPHALKVRAIADAAGCSTTGVYTWFGGKQGLIEAVWLDSFRRFGNALNTVEWQQFGRQIDGLVAGIEAYREWAIANRSRYLLMFANSIEGFTPSNTAAIEALGTFQILIDAVARCQNEGSIVAGNAIEIANHLWASSHGHVMLELASHAGPGPFAAAAYRRSVDLLLAGVAAR